MARVILTADIGFGDAGKGSIVDWLVRENASPLVVRYNGGAQAAHTVVLDDGRQHTFAQFGAGTLAGAKTYLSRHMVIAPDLFLNEARHLIELGLQDPGASVFVDGRCPLATPFHRVANEAREIARGDARHGSCGLGIGEARADTSLCPEAMLYAGDLQNPRIMRAKLLGIRERKRALLTFLGQRSEALDRDDILGRIIDLYDVFSRTVNLVDDDFMSKQLQTGDTIVFEGAQGALLDQSYGFFPHVTYSDTTFRNADHLLNECGYSGERFRLGITRCFSTRHGAGPFPAENERLGRWFIDKNNHGGPWQGRMRYGWFDAILARYGIDVLGGIDGLAITCLDRMRGLPAPRIVSAYSGVDGRPWFEFDKSGLAVHLSRCATPSQGEQQSICEALFDVRAISYPVRSDTVIQTICGLLGVRPNILSYGPKARDKSYAPELLLRHAS